MLTGKREKKMNRRFFMGGVLGSVLALGLLAAPHAFADQLDDMRVSGAVGEAFDGFARARAAFAEDFVSDLNAQRRQIYIKRAKSQGVSVDQVGRVYAVQIVKKAPSGTWILSESGDWSQK